MPEILKGLEAPYYAVIFTATPSTDTSGYPEALGRMLELVKTMPGVSRRRGGRRGKRRNRGFLLA